jgi:hypothetical protein
VKTLIALFVALVVASSVVSAHPMTYKGTVVSVGESTVEVKAMDDMTKKEVTKKFKVNEKTKILRGEKAVTFAEAKIEKDERIAVTINMDTASDVALEIKLAAAK